MQLGEIEAEFPFGILLVTDEGSSEVIPEWGSPEEQATCADSAAVVRVRHADEGRVTVRIWDDEREVVGALAFDGRLTIESGTVKVSDALGSVGHDSDRGRGPVD
ncbi:MAG TPA: hypothetical protein VK988_22405 [Acidimicrobiales bacterium]|nr:hypothetical protein [Acidimicrobiales bacterium]